MTIRDRFPIFQTKTYINSCSQGALSLDVQHAYQEYMQDWQEKGQEQTHNMWSIYFLQEIEV